MRIVSNKVISLITGICILLTCTSCKSEHYRVGEYLNDLAYSTGINLNLNEEDSFNSLKEYGIVENKDKEIISDDLKVTYLRKTINNFLNDDNKTKLYLLDVVKDSKSDNHIVKKEEAKQIIEKLVKEINNPKFEEKTIIEEKDDVLTYREDEKYEIGDILYFDDENKYKKVIAIIDDEYVYEKAEAEEVYEKIDIAGEYEINFDDAEIVDLYDDFENIQIIETASSYTNNIYNLLSSKRHNFKKDGFNVAYTINSGSIDFRISKSIDKGVTMFFDTSLSGVKPTYKWDNTGENLNAFFKIDFDMTNEIGLSTGKYENYYLDLKDQEGKNLLSHLKKLNTKDDVLEATIPICTIKTPIPNIPTATFNIDVLAKFYLSGKVEVLLQNEGTVGFEIKDKKFRVVHDLDKDYDFVIGASTRGVAGLNFNICTCDYRLMDLEIDAGVRAALSPTIHLFDEDGDSYDEYIDEEYYALYEATKENKDVSLCADLTLNWVLDLNLNTSKSLLYKYGFSRKKTILDKSNQVFNNLTHIENFQFVKTCTHKNKKRIQKKDNIKTYNSEKIALTKYSLVLIQGRSAEVPIKYLPSGYSINDLVYETSESKVATVKQNGIIDSEGLGSCKITIKTSDEKYVAYLNVLVSTG